MKKLFAIGLLISAALCLNAQPLMTIKGKILDKNQGDGVPFALLLINNQPAYADLDGYFEVAIPTAKKISIKASQVGYESTEKDFVDHFEHIELIMVSKAIILEEVLISDQPSHSQPQSNTIVDAGRMVTQPRDVGDLFDAIPGFNLIKKGGYALDPIFRSFKYEQLNLIYDGGIQTTYACPGRMDPTTTHINPQDVEKIEVIRGPFSVRYGPTMGAIINVVTDKNQHQLGYGGSVEGGFETNGNSKITKVQLYGASQRFDLGVSGGLKDFGSYRSGDGRIIPASFKTYDYNFKLGYKPTEDQRLQINWRQAINRDVLHAGLPMDTESDDSDFLSIDYNWKNISPKLFRLNLKAYGTQVDHVMTNHLRPNFMMVDAAASVSAQTFGGKAELSILPNQKTTVYMGTDYRYIGRSGDRVRLMKRNMMTGEELAIPMRMVDAIWQEAQIQDAGFFVEGKYFQNPRWTFALGARVDWVNAEARDPVEDFAALYDNLSTDSELNFSGTASATFITPSDWSLQLAFGRGIRTANMIERYINHFTVGADAYEYVGNPNLKPEVNNQLEISVQKQKENNGFGLNIFYSYLQDFITASVDPSLPRKFMGSLPYARRFTNINEAVQFGFELTSQLQLTTGWLVNGSVGYTQAQNLEWDEPLAEISPLAARLGLRYEAQHWWMEIESRFVSQQKRVSERFNEGTTPAYQVIDLRTSIDLVQNLSIGMAVLNILDKHYRTHLNRAYRNTAQPGIIFEPGRNMTIFAKYTF